MCCWRRSRGFFMGAHGVRGGACRLRRLLMPAWIGCGGCGFRSRASSKISNGQGGCLRSGDILLAFSSTMSDRFLGSLGVVPHAARGARLWQGQPNASFAFVSDAGVGPYRIFTTRDEISNPVFCFLSYLPAPFRLKRVVRNDSYFPNVSLPLRPWHRLSCATVQEC